MTRKSWLKYGILSIVTVALLIALLPACAPKGPEKVHWDLNWSGGPRVMTFPVEDFAADMAELTGGLWEIKVHYGETLSPYSDNPDGIKDGLFEGGLLFAAVCPGKLPLQTVVELPFMAPGTVATMGEWTMEVFNHPALVKEMDQWDTMVMFSCPLATYEWMGTKRVAKVEDLKGVRIRGNPDMGAPLAAYGAVMEMMPGSETYTGIERGMIDGAIWVWTYTFGSYKLYELSKYATNGMMLAQSGVTFGVSKTAYNALPDKWKELAQNWVKTTWIPAYEKYNALADAKWLPKFAEKGIEIVPFPPEERAKLIEKAKPTWEAWVKRMEDKGLPGREVLNFAIAKRDEVLAKAK